jgi:hypothetical protein
MRHALIIKIRDPTVLYTFFLISLGRRVIVGEEAAGLSDFFGQAMGHDLSAVYVEELVFDRGTSAINDKNDNDLISFKLPLHSSPPIPEFV